MNLESDIIRSIEEPVIGEYSEKGSKFIAYTFPFEDKDELPGHLKSLKKLHPKSRHICYAYQIGLDEPSIRVNDDGEPSSSAGKPILSQIKKNQLTNVLACVVRYFGGTKLGIPGLIRSYKAATAASLEWAMISERYIESEYLIEFKYEKLGEIIDKVKKQNISILEKRFEANPSLLIGVRKKYADEIIHTLRASFANLKPEEMDTDFKLDFVSILPYEGNVT